MAARKTSKSWFVKLRSPMGLEREERVTGVTTPEEACALVTPVDGEEVIGARPVRKYKVTEPVLNDLAESPDDSTP
jgi:hypothetical protein